MATITITDIPDNVYVALKETAKAHRRSINDEVIYCIEEAVMSRHIDVEYTLARAREIRALTAGQPISDEELTDAINRGRL